MAKTKRKNIWLRILLWGFLLIALIVGGALLYLDSQTYAPSNKAESAFQGNTEVAVTEVKDGFKFEPADGSAIQPNIIFYPGGLVEPESYSPFASELAKLGHRVYIAKMPLNLAIFGQNKADSFVSEHPGESYIIGGHSLGGAFAARYANQHSDKLIGIYFLASYADDGGTLADTSLSALQITGSADGVLNWEEWEKTKSNLPQNTAFVSIEGGNHGQFGSYGKQKGDNDPQIGEAEQLEQVIEAMQNWIEQLSQ
ncbi:alpha/beta hydrolase [Paenibacillus sp. CAU 1782]